ncbi:MAG TPA: acyl-CoA dehydrogenase family protein [Pseudomonadales bacterium]|jgi:alkylation response protein AidB-like acyl-CoA dehydrogenase|nr:acyl-CoA dehydrogenase family protein [Pseudomonadales bacterium]MDP6315322.1 acyl-CoA dehydrogenase family protein [Pseudomonadales bacterium]MDP7314770.1 acyl-CoA dehydrogenase family protein [Pseudomonadales bacterium]HJL61007.1 acyl-CoA dehydrogenase family protein [Pseudomonadales bacterium]|tara:strand:- start:33973 stop:35127 length:1155 start_codon:yes stop_codon:yes gene_type:complete
MQDDVLSRARVISDLASAQADEADKNANVSTELIAEMKKAGIFKLCIPSTLGGDEVHPMESLDVIDIIAQGDGSTAWVTMVCATTALVSAYLNEEWSEKIYGQDGVITCGVTAPSGRARLVDGGIEVSGRWQWGSGTSHADWILGGSLLVDEDGQPVKDGEGRIHHLLPFFKKDQIQILDTWDVHGMSGSGSNDFMVEDVFVPEGRWIRFGADRPRLPGLYQFPLLGMLGLGVASISLGVARRAIDELIDLAAGKIPVASATTLGNRAYVQSAVAEAEAALRSAKALMREAVADAWEPARDGQLISKKHRAILRLATTNASRQATRAVDLMYNAAGGTPVYNRSPLARLFRDAHVATQHIMVGPPTYELVGRVLMGMDTDTSTL